MSDDIKTDSVVWLRNQYARHKEIEDNDAADEIENLREQLAEKDREIKHAWNIGARHEAMCRSEEISALKAEIERMRPVVEAAVEQAHNSVESFIAMAAIELAVEEYEKSKP